MSIRTAVIEVSLQRLSLLRIEHPQANPLTLACTLRAGESLPSGLTVKAEVHASRNVAAETIPLASSTVSVAADATSFEVSFSSAQLNQVVAPNSVRTLWLVVYGVGHSDALYTLAAAEVALGWHAISQITPPPPSVALLADVGGSPWASGVTYQTNHIVGAGGSIYLAVADHTSAAATQPGAGADWQTVWALFQGGTGPGGGNTILSGAGAPSNAVGSNGDFWINTTAWFIYGPKAAGAWPAGVSMIGPQGIQGPQGPQGLQGLTGATGLTGPAGAAGAAATVTVGTVTTGAAGTSATVTNVGTSSAAVFNFVIPRGNTGLTGAAGAAATIAIGTVTTLAPGSPATVTNVGTSSAAVLNFGIPQGADGTGGTGGATIALGTVTTGAAGTSVVITNTGAASAAVFNFTIPRGDTGAQGPQGIQGPQGLTGAAATVTVGTVTTGAAGTSASVTNSGSTSAAVFNFVIPRGETGATGPQGLTGAAGAAATVTVGTVTTGAAGTSASVTNVGTSAAAVFNFVIPRGDTGATGPQGLTGAAGAAATVTVGTVTTLPAGSAATVTNVGTSLAAVFNFGIPQGAAGTGGGGGGDPIQTYRASQLIPATTNGAGVDSLENGWNRDYLTFPLSANRYAELEIGWPTGWVGYQYRVIWRSTGTTGNVLFRSEARCFADSSAETGAAGTAVDLTDSASGTAQQVMVSDWSATVTPGGSVADGAPTQIRIGRIGLSETSPLSQTVWVQIIQLRAAPV